jgi:hypothetical protein
MLPDGRLNFMEQRSYGSGVGQLERKALARICDSCPDGYEISAEKIGHDSYTWSHKTAVWFVEALASYLASRETRS